MAPNSGSSRTAPMVVVASVLAGAVFVAIFGTLLPTLAGITGAPATWIPIVFYAVAVADVLIALWLWRKLKAMLPRRRTAGRCSASSGGSRFRILPPGSPRYHPRMIISASYRSDIPAFHGDWFLAALAAGEVAVANPYNQRPSLIDLRPQAVDGYVFWTRNARPFTRGLEAVAAQGKPFVVQYTIIGYPRSIDANVIDPALAIANARSIAASYGPHVVVWRYDPILLTPATEATWHHANFVRLADALAGTTDEVVVSFAQLYAKSARNLAKAGITWRVPALEEEAALMGTLRDEAEQRGITLTLCTQPHLAAASPARCIDAVRLGEVAGRPIEAATKGNRPGCLCAESRDIGAYDSCVHGCRYCYAVGDHEAVQRRMRQDRSPAPAASN